MIMNPTENFFALLKLVTFSKSVLICDLDISLQGNIAALNIL